MSRMDFLSAFTPEGISGLVAFMIVVVAFFTSAITGAFGLGGGLALLAAMSILFPPAAVVPVHGVAQLGSNASRWFLLREHSVWAIVLWFTIGAALGSVLGALVVVELSEELLRLGIALFILFTVWVPKPKSYAAGNGFFFAGGAVSSFLTMFFGATGPIVATILSATKLDRMQVVSTHALCLLIQHGFKTLAFGALGFAFAEWAPLILAIIAAGFAGSYVGTHFLKKMPETDFQMAFKVLLTLVAIYIIAVALIPKAN